ncbi:MAG: hypothetical protein K2X07_11585 [Caulobacteraceae bacterium]|nr:hypothetical protein [Caulobacteraceae bacterium]
MKTAAIIPAMMAALLPATVAGAQTNSDQALFDVAFEFCLSSFEARAAGLDEPEPLDWNGRAGGPMGVWERQQTFVMRSPMTCTITQDRSAADIADGLPARLESLGFSPNPDARGFQPGGVVWDRLPVRVMVERVKESQVEDRVVLIFGIAAETD